MPLKDIAKELIILLGITVVTAFAFNSFSPNGIALFGDWDTSKGVITAKPKDDVVTHELEIGDVITAKEIYDSGAVFVDARSENDYLAGHIRGAISLPVWQLEDRIGEFINEIPTHVLIVTYCSGRECDDSHELAQCLLDEGYTNVRVFIDGYPSWKEEGYPIGK